MNYYTKKDFPGLKAGALLQFNEEKQMYYCDADSYAEFILFPKEEVENNPESFSLGKQKSNN